MALSDFELAVLRKMVSCSGGVEAEARFDETALRVVSRSTSAYGFIVEIADTHSPPLLGQSSIRWGGDVICLINLREEAGVVGYVDEGHITGVEGYTFSGDAWPHRVESFSFRTTKGGSKANT